MKTKTKITLYHGTNEKNMRLILKTGLRKNSSLSADYNVSAGVFADLHKYTNNKGFVITFIVPTKLVKRYNDFHISGDDDDYNPEHEYRNIVKLSKLYITEVKRI